MKLQDYAAAEPLTVEAEFPPDSGSGFWVTVRFLPAAELRRLQNEAANKTFVLKGGSVRTKDEEGQEVLDAGLARLIVSWRGLTPNLAAAWIPALNLRDLKAALKEQGVTEIPCEDENKLFLVRSVHGFSEFLRQTATEAELFLARQTEADAKNLRQSSGGKGGSRPTA